MGTTVSASTPKRTRLVAKTCNPSACPTHSDTSGPMTWVICSRLSNTNKVDSAANTSARCPNGSVSRRRTSNARDKRNATSMASVASVRSQNTVREKPPRRSSANSNTNRVLPTPAVPNRVNSWAPPSICTATASRCPCRPTKAPRR